MEYSVENIQGSAFAITRWMVKLLQNWGVSDQFADAILMILQLTVVIVLTYFFQWATKRIVRFILEKSGQSKRLRINKHLVRNNFPSYLALFVPFTWLQNTVPIVFENYPKLESIADKLLELAIVLIIYQMLISIVKSISHLVLTYEKYKDKPIESYFQVIRIILMIFAIGAIISILTSITMKAFFTSMGAASAVMMLIFKDTILGLVASIQVTTNDMVRKGDWITMPKYNADGDVQKITLNTVKVVNFDKTIITIPTYALISESFQNWRGMQASGGRRIKRTINIKQSSIRFISEEELNRFEKIQFLKTYIPERQSEIEAHNRKINADRVLPVNGRNLTNIGLFRNYSLMYLRSLQTINQKMNIMVRQLAPGAEGLPVEIYCFSNTIKWAEYEEIMADVFDHLIAATPYFDLEIFENSSSNDTVGIKQINE